MTGDVNSDDVLCRVVAEHTNSAVVNIDYRLTPEHKWPTQLEDSMKVYKWVRVNMRIHQNAKPLLTLRRPTTTPLLSTAIRKGSTPLAAPLAEVWRCRLPTSLSRTLS